MTPDDIRDIRAPISIPYWWIPLAIAAAVVVASALGYGIYRLVRRLRRERAMTAAEVALGRILRARALLAKSSSSEFSHELSAAVRAYIEARFSLRAAHRTTEEFLRDLVESSTHTAADALAPHRELLQTFLSWCDLAKFAKLAFSEADADAIALSARQFVEATAATRKDETPARASHSPTSPPTPRALEVPS